MTRRIGDPIELRTKHGLVGVFHVRYDEKEGVCLLGQKQVPIGDPFPLRVQSSCLFSESFWATDCDCAWQLQEALSYIVAQGGMVIYFYEEGRGAGLETKIEAIRLQQRANMSTTEAYECLRLEPDVRNYAAVGYIVGELLGNDRPVALLTNNPRKEKLICEAGVRVVERRPLVYDLGNPATIEYLKEKIEVLGHEIDFG